MKSLLLRRMDFGKDMAIDIKCLLNINNIKLMISKTENDVTSCEHKYIFPNKTKQN